MTPDLIPAHALVFAASEGAIYRAGRSLRLLQRCFAHVTDATRLQSTDLARIVFQSNEPLWLVRAGSIPRDLSNWFLPPPNGKPLCAFGITSLYADSSAPRSAALLNESLQNELAAIASESAQWLALQEQTGGDFSIVERFGEQCPPIASVLLDPRLARPLSESLAARCDIDAAIRAMLKATAARCVRLPHLDVIDDPVLRVAQVVTSLQRGGAERITLDLVRELPHWRVRARLFVFGSPMRAAFPTPEESVTFSPGRNRAEHVRNFARHAVEMGFDLVHAHLLSADDMAIIAEHGLPVVATVHNVRQGWPAGFTQRAAVAASLGGGAALLAACAQAVERDVLDANLAVPVRTIWNGIEWREYQSSPERKIQAQGVRRQLELVPNDFVLLALANPRPQKRLERLPAVLAALRALLKSRGSASEAKLIIAGEASRGSDDALRCAAELHAEITRLNLSEHVRVIGANEQVAPLLLACDALVSVSAWEGLSLAHLEALAAGLPVVATDAGGTSEIARDFPALKLVPLDASPQSISEIIANIAAGTLPPPTVDERSRANFALHTMAARYASLYPRAIASSRTPGAPETRPTGIWLIANNFTTGGAQSSARRLLLGMKARGVRVRAAVLQEHEDNPTPGLSALRKSGVPVFVTEMRSRDPLDAVQQILERIDTDPPRTILFWNVIAEHKILLADAILGIPIYDVSPGEMFFDSLDQYFARPRPGLPYRSGAKYGARLAGAVVKYRAEASRAENCLRTVVHVIPNGLPLHEWPSAARPDNSRIVIGTSARLSPQKKLEELLEALRIAAPDLPPHVLRIAGRAETGAEEYAARLRTLSDGLSVEWIEEFQDSKQFLAGLDIFAMISEPAGCPNASLEAMAAGLPVIATDHGGASEQVVDGVTGRLVPRGDAHAFAAAIIELSHDAAKCRAFGSAGRASVAQRFSVERMVDDYVRLCLGA